MKHESMITLLDSKEILIYLIELSRPEHEFQGDDVNGNWN